MNRRIYFSIFILLLFAGKVEAQCTISINAGATSVCINTSPGTITAVAGGSPGPFTYQWYKAGAPAGANSATYDPGILAVPTAVYCTITDGSCPITTSNTINFTIVPNASIASVSGATPICIGGSATYSANSVVLGGGTGAWSSSNIAVASVNSSGVVTGVSAGSSIITYTITLGCGGTVLAQQSITITPNASVGSVSGVSPICTSSSTTYIANSIVTGGGTGTWSSSNSGIASVVPSTGLVTGIAAGTCNIIFTISGGCGIANASSPITITAPGIASISYTGSPWCGSDGVQTVTLTGTTGGTFSSTAGLSIVPATGAINPAASTAGTYSVSYTLAPAGGCGSSSSSTSVTISPTPTAPVVGSVTQPTCSVATGSVVLNGLPSSGTWTLTRSPGAVTTTGTGTSFTINTLAPGTYTYTVTNSALCTSPSSLNIVINAQPPSPLLPTETIDCSLGFGHGTVNITSPLGLGIEYSLDGGAFVATPAFLNVVNGSHYISVRNSAGCITPGPLFTVTCGCINAPTLVLGSTAGSTCGTAPITITGNSFGGSASNVTITENGAGSVTPASPITTTPFSFTYTPTAADGGKIVLITVTTNNPVGGACVAAAATYTLTVNAMPSAPTIGLITNLTCSVSTGSVVLNGLPVTGTWTLTRNPGAVLTSGTGVSTTVSNLAAGTYNFIITSAEGCISAVSADAVIAPAPSAPTAPVIGAITQPTCALSTGSVGISGLPATGTWTLNRNPGAVTITGTGITTTVSALPAGVTYTFSVTNATGCTSSVSANVVINTQPSIPPAPSIGTITAPTCALATGSVVLAGLPSTGTWTLIRYPGTISITGTGTSTTIPGLSPGTYNFTVTTADGCLSTTSSNLVIPAQPPTPSTPVVGAVTQPTLAVPSGSVALSGLPSTGTWVITRLPGLVTVSGTGINKTVTNLPGGVFTFTVTNAGGCTSAESNSVTISTSGNPIVTITNPPVVCSPETVDITNSSITAGSTPGLIYTYWNDSGATTAYTTPTAATAGTYYIKGTTVAGFYTIKPVMVNVDLRPVPNAGEDQTLYSQTTTDLNASLNLNETGSWSVYSGTGTFASKTDPKTSVSSLSLGDNLLLWQVNKGVCPAIADTVNIVVKNLVISTLITPNMDGKNDYFVIKGLSAIGKTSIVIFDRRGAEVYKNLNYDNTWNGIDFNSKPLPDDTYFWVLKSESGKSLSGYIVIRH